MRISRPSPSMVIASVALFVSLGGTSIAAVSFARNAGAVDGKSAVSASGTVSHAAGRLVATNKSGPDKGMIPGKFLAGVPHTQTFGKSFEVADNAPGAPITVGDAAGVGSLTATCNDQSAAPGVEDPTTTLNFVNSSGQIINIARRVGNGDGAVGLLASGTVAPLTIAGSNTFFYHVQTTSGVNLLINGVVRQDGRGTPTANCLVFGTVLEIS
jgi:hypothetical protein